MDRRLFAAKNLSRVRGADTGEVLDCRISKEDHLLNMLSKLSATPSP